MFTLTAFVPCAVCCVVCRRVAEEWGSLVKELWSNRYRVVAPRRFKEAIGEFAPRFSGYQQQDSSELLSFLLDGLHEDLNQVKKKPPTATVESNGRSDDVVAAEAWAVHQKRNRSIVVDRFQGQLKSRLVCPVCPRVSITFDPFMFLSVPLPTVNDKSQLITFVSADYPAQPAMQYAVNVSKAATTVELRQALSALTGVTARRLVLGNVWGNRVWHFLAEDAMVADIRAHDSIYAWGNTLSNLSPSPLSASQIQPLNLLCDVWRLLVCCLQRCRVWMR
jgi:uncharacterized UBP type Zn finger protein